MNTNFYQKKKNKSLILLIVFILIACAGAVYFYVESLFAENKAKAIDSAQYSPSIYQKGERKEAVGIPLVTTTEENLTDNLYKTPLGFSIISYSNKWKGEMLVDIYNQLLSNTHGDEIRYISEVDIYPGSSDIDTDETIILGTQSSSNESYPIFFDLPSLIPSSLKYDLHSTVSKIELYNMDMFDTDAEAASTIAHEYGHHYTKYYFMQSDETTLTSEYYIIRNFADMGHDPIDWNNYIEEHEWNIYEIAAEDYVQLMGGPDTRQVKHYNDTYDSVMSGDDSFDYPDENTKNVLPQENIYIPLADEVSGLRDYYYSFIGKDNVLDPLQTADFNITSKKRVSNGYVYYDITWTKTSTDKDAIYTLVCYDLDGDILKPVKTIFGDEEPIARVGAVTKVNGLRITGTDDHIPDNDRIFKLYLMLPDGRMQASEPVRINF